MFHDYAKIRVKSGDGGNGIVAFRREKYVPLGGPSGGDGGRGGNIIFLGDGCITTLLDFKYKRHYKAERGSHGKSKNKHGANAPDLVLKVPLGTIIRDENQIILADIVRQGQEALIVKGGRGGRGNARFATAQKKAPKTAEKGEPGAEKTLILELKLLADVGLVGLPNAGKSTFISRISAARPKIAPYPFTTLSPNLGVVEMEDGNAFLAADLPGIVSGAADGAGLGHRFLRHMERNRLLLHLVDMSPPFEGENKDPFNSYAAVNNELARYKKSLAELPQIIVASKMDVPGAEECLREFRSKLSGNEDIYPISALKDYGIRELLSRVQERLAELPLIPEEKEEEEILRTLVRREESFYLEREEDNLWTVKGGEIEKLVAMTYLENEDSLNRLQNIFLKMGLEEALRKAGVKNGDTVSIGGEVFEYTE
jgi:GTP-binding protein